MGCDIHLRVQVLAPRKVEKNTRHDGSTYDWVEEFSYKGWRAMENKIPNKYWSPEYDEDDPRHTIEKWYSGRNYNFFAILADVRNGSGFAEVRTGEGFNPIDQPRGLPADLGDLAPLKEETVTADGFWLGDHSHSYVTLTELLAVKWNEATTTHYGVVSPSEYLIFKEKGRPESWASDVSGSMVRKVTNHDMDRLIASDEADLDGSWSSNKIHYVTSIQWQSTYKDSVGPNVMAFIDRLKDLADEWADGDTNRVRLVFGFDS